MSNCVNTKTMGHGHIVKCGENIYGKNSPVYICEECLKKQVDRLTVIIEERSQLVDEIYRYGKRNPTSSPQCIIDLIEHIDSEIE